MRHFVSLLLLVLSLSVQADTYYRVKGTFTGNPSNGDTVTINGVTKTFRAAVATASTEIQIGATATDTAANWDAHNHDYPYSRIGSTQSGTSVELLGEINFTVTASMTGTWGTVVASPQTITQFPLVLPLSGESSTTRTNRANALVNAFDHATTPFSASLTALQNYMPISGDRTNSAANLFTGANVFSNASQLFYYGQIIGANVTNAPYLLGTNVYVMGPLLVQNTSPGVFWNDYDGTSGNRMVGMHFDDGQFKLLFWDDLAATSNVVMTVTRSGLAPQIISFPAGTVQPAKLVSSDIEGVLTNATGGFTNVYSQRAFITSILALTNATPKITFHDTDGSTDNKRVNLTANNGDFAISIESDDLGTTSTPFQILRTGNNVDSVYIGGPANVSEVEGTLWVYGTTLAQGNIQSSGIIGVGSTNILAPTGMSAGILQTNAATEASADPSNAVASWAYNSEWKYRLPSAGVNYRVHNAASQVTGAGTDYPLTGSYAQVTYGSGGNTISLPTAGTYLVEVVAAIDMGGSANDNVALKLYNATAAADISNSERQISYIPASSRGQLRLSNVITVTTATTLHLYAKNITAARGNVIATQTSMSYVRLY